MIICFPLSLDDTFPTLRCFLVFDLCQKSVAIFLLYFVFFKLMKGYSEITKSSEKIPRAWEIPELLKSFMCSLNKLNPLLPDAC